MTYSIMRQLPVLAPSIFGSTAAWAPGVTRCSWIWARILELAYTAWDLESFARDISWDGAPFRWNDERRFFIRAELDAAFFHMYELSRSDAQHVLDSFAVVRKSDERNFGEYRTKRVILEIYDEMAEAARTGKPFQTRLDPPPADPSLTHPPRSPVKKRASKS